MPNPLLGNGLPRKVVLQHHLMHNHYPPVGSQWIDTADAAIEAVLRHAVLADDGTIEFDDFDFFDEPLAGDKTIGQIMEELHLWDFVSFEVYARQEAGDEPKRGE